MRILEIRAYEGLNIHSHKPVVEMWLDLGEYRELETKAITGFNDRLLALFPGLWEHHCALGKPGGFVERLKEGTLLGHVVEHVALELQTLAGMSVTYGKTRQSKTPGVYRVVVSYRSKEAGIKAVRAAVRLVEAVLEDKEYDPEEEVRKIKNVALRTGLGPSTAAIAGAAKERGIPVLRLSEELSLLQLGYGKYQKRVQATVTQGTGCIAVDLACDKTLTKKILSEAGVPVPAGILARTRAEALRAAERLGYPVVVKPRNGNQGKGVSLNLTSEKEVNAAFELAKNYGETVIVEKFVPGKHYRVLVVGDQVVAASERIPAQVVGDGEHTIRELIVLTNQDPQRGEEHEKPLTKIKIDPVVLMVLARQNLTMNYIPEKGEKVRLRENANLSTGGTAVDVTDEIHPENSWLAVRAARLIGLDVAGVDLVARDIATPITPSNGAVIEVNACPGIRMHHYPSKGKARDAGRAIVDYLFPPGIPSRIPVVSITGTNGKTTVTRLVSHILREAGLTPGMTTSDGIYIGEKRVLAGDTTGPRSARVVLTDPTVDVAVLETARGGILRGGLGYDQSEVGVLLNVTEDHLGQDEIDTLEQLVDVKSLVLEAVRIGGWVVLNANDSRLLQLKDRVCRKRRLLYFSAAEGNLTIHKHLAQGGSAVYIKNEHVVMGDKNEEVALLRVTEIPITHQGKVAHNIENAVAAVAVARALGIDREVIKRGLMTFTSNPGRFEFEDINGVKLVIDYGHNEAGYTRVLQAVAQLKPARKVGVIGVPGDRCDESIRKVGKLAGRGFDFIYIKEDQDLRGRKPGEVAGLLAEGALEVGMKEDEMEIILSEAEAVGTALRRAGPGDLVVVFHEKLDRVKKAVAEFKRSHTGTDSAQQLAVAGGSVQENTG